MQKSVSYLYAFTPVGRVWTRSDLNRWAGLADLWSGGVTYLRVYRRPSHRTVACYYTQPPSERSTQSHSDRETSRLCEHLGDSRRSVCCEPGSQLTAWAALRAVAGRSGRGNGDNSPWRPSICGRTRWWDTKILQYNIIQCNTIPYKAIQYRNLYGTKLPRKHEHSHMSKQEYLAMSYSFRIPSRQQFWVWLI